MTVYRKGKRKATLSLKNNGLKFSFNNFVQPLHFLGRMAQLERSLLSGAQGTFSYALSNTWGDSLLIVLERREAAGAAGSDRVSFRMWRGTEQAGRPAFGWDGLSMEFRNAVSAMLQSAGCA